MQHVRIPPGQFFRTRGKDMKPELQDWLLDHHKTVYDLQIETADKFQDRANFIFGIYSILGGAYLYVASNLTDFKPGWIDIIILFAIIPGALLFITSIIMTLLALIKEYDYDFIPGPRDVQDYTDQLQKFADANPDENVDVLTDVKTRMIESYSAAADTNTTINTTRTNALTRSTTFASTSFFFLLFALPFFGYHMLNKQDSPTSVIIQQPIEVKK